MRRDHDIRNNDNGFQALTGLITQNVREKTRRYVKTVVIAASLCGWCIHNKIQVQLMQLRYDVQCGVLDRI